MPDTDVAAAATRGCWLRHSTALLEEMLTAKRAEVNTAHVGLEISDPGIEPRKGASHR